jgi:hypothetical protein
MSDLLSYTAEAILLQFIDLSIVGFLDRDELTIDELLVFETKVLSLIDQFHNLRVYRLDLSNTYNIFWDHSSIMIFCDFENVVVRDKDDDDDRYFNNIIYWDKAQVNSILQRLRKLEAPLPESLLCMVPCVFQLTLSRSVSRALAFCRIVCTRIVVATFVLTANKSFETK